MFDIPVGPPNPAVTGSQGVIVGVASGTGGVVIEAGGLTQTIPVTVQ